MTDDFRQLIYKRLFGKLNGFVKASLHALAFLSVEFRVELLQTRRWFDR